MAVRSRPSSGSTSSVLKSASTGVLRPLNVRGQSSPAAEDDPVQRVLNRSWQRPSSKNDEELKDGERVVRRAGRYGTTGTGLFVDTGRRATLPSYIGSYAGSEGDAEIGSEIDTVRTGEGDSQVNSPVLSPGLARIVRRRSVDTVVPPKRRYSFEICPVTEATPRLRSPPRAPHGRRGSFKLVFEEDDEKTKEAGGLDDMARTFVDMVSKLQNLINQTSLRMNKMLVVIRKRHSEDPSFTEQMHNMHLLSEVVFMVLTANYYLGKWHHELDPSTALPSKPSSQTETPADELLAQVGASISRMEERAGKLSKVLQKIVSDAKNLRRGPGGEPISPTSKNPATLAMKRGFQDVEQMPQIIGHMEHLLMLTEQLAHPVSQGHFKMKEAATVLQAAQKFMALKKASASNKDAGASEAVTASLSTIAASVESSEVAADSGSSPITQDKQSP